MISYTECLAATTVFFIFRNSYSCAFLLPKCYYPALYHSICYNTYAERNKFLSSKPLISKINHQGVMLLLQEDRLVSRGI